MNRYKAIGTCLLNGKEQGVRVLDKQDCILYDMKIGDFEKIKEQCDTGNIDNIIEMIDTGDKITTQYEIENYEISEGKPFENHEYTYEKMIKDMKILEAYGWEFDVDIQDVINGDYRNDVFTGKKDMFMIQFDTSQIASGMKYNIVRVWGYNVRIQTPSDIHNIMAGHGVCGVCMLRKKNLKKKKFILVCDDCINGGNKYGHQSL